MCKYVPCGGTKGKSEILTLNACKNHWKGMGFLELKYFYISTHILKGESLFHRNNCTVTATWV